MRNLKLILTVSLITACGTESDTAPTVNETESKTIGSTVEQVAIKLNNPECVDPELSSVANTTSLMLCNGKIVAGTLEVPEKISKENLLPENIKKGVVIADVTGIYEPDTIVETKTITVTTYIDDTTQISSCSSNGQIDCVASNDFKAADLSNLSESVLKAGVSVAGVSGTLIEEAHADCDDNGQTGCVANNSYKSINFSELTPEKIKAGITIAGINGAYPSTAYPLENSTATEDLNTFEFNTQITSSNTFEWFDSKGIRHTASGSDQILPTTVKQGTSLFGVNGGLSTEAPNAYDLKAGVTINGVTGAVKTNCRNMAFYTVFGKDANAIDNVAGTPTDAVANWWDTLEDLGTFIDAYPIHTPVGWTDANICGSENWEIDTTVNNCDNGDLQCVVKDNLSGLEWTNIMTANTDIVDEFNATQISWKDAVEGCMNLTTGGHDDWRLPTQKEAMQAYINGISRLSTNGPGTNNFDNFFPAHQYGWSTNIWTATTVSGSYASTSTRDVAWRVTLRTGSTWVSQKERTGAYMCVR